MMTMAIYVSRLSPLSRQASQPASHHHPVPVLYFAGNISVAIYASIVHEFEV
jgi:hypothetical protein